MLVCPSCGARHSIEGMVHDEAARELAALAVTLGDLGRPALSYLGLFRGRKRALRWTRALSLMREIAEAVRTGTVRRRGRDVAIRPDAWAPALEQVLDARDRGRLQTPLRDHAYLWEVAIGRSERAAGEEEARRDEERRQRPRPSSAPGGASAPITHAQVREHVARAREALGMGPSPLDGECGSC